MEARPSDIEIQTTQDPYIMEARSSDIETQTTQGPISNESEIK